MEILQRYQERGLLKEEALLSSLNSLIAPLMVSHMFRRANLDFPIPVVDPQEHVEAFLLGRKQ